MPEGDSLYRFAATLRPALQGKAIVAARAHGPGPVPQVHRIVGATCTGVRAQGKNMLISFDNGLVLRGHLRMYGTWHVYKPGAAWTRPEREARLVLDVGDAVVVNFSAPVIELLEERALAVHGPIRRPRPESSRRRLRCGRGVPAPAGTRQGSADDRRCDHGPAGARGRRQYLEERIAVPLRHQPVAPRWRTGRRNAPRTHPEGAGTASGERTQAERIEPAAATVDVGLHAGRTAMPALPHAACAVRPRASTFGIRRGARSASRSWRGRWSRRCDTERPDTRRARKGRRTAGRAAGRRGP